jgi:hypothetical protein
MVYQSQIWFVSLKQTANYECQFTLGLSQMLKFVSSLLWVCMFTNEGKFPEKTFFGDQT